MTLTDTRVDDGYPTRITGTPAHLPRVHPTVWGTEADGPIDAATLANHETRGYTVVEDLLSVGEVQTYWQELVRLSSDALIEPGWKTGVLMVGNEYQVVPHVQFTRTYWH